jgi:hypothetical protein
MLFCSFAFFFFFFFFVCSANTVICTNREKGCGCTCACSYTSSNVECSEHNDCWCCIHNDSGVVFVVVVIIRLKHSGAN